MAENVSRPSIEITHQKNVRIIRLRGAWTLLSLKDHPFLAKELAACRALPTPHWHLSDIDTLDSAGAFVIWQAWGKTMPEQTQLKPDHQNLFKRWQECPPIQRVKTKKDLTHQLLSVSEQIRGVLRQIHDGVILVGQLVLDFLYLLRKPGEIPWAEISMTIFDAGVRALGITALVGFLIGVVLSYLSALQLQAFGAEIYIIDILGLSILRELGPLLAAILVAGRSGSAMTAQIGIMRVTEELDALSAMGISHSLRLIFPKVIALLVTLPLLTIWTDVAALLGGMLSANHQLDISMQQFFVRLPNSVPLVNIFIGLLKASVFGVLIALVACHFGFMIKPNTESLGNETTNSVVAAITIVIMTDAVFAILFMKVGMP
ncbi:MlaE family ABC transporter permease [Methylicorpusculum sp.]|uniref:MlaE family ABC transporter permease n=1 Tax=Methylicorpusculum sp. TaxID=2713644 RepID=UPI0027320B77|nr:ABC transporter permease [Methylicorpusculum sp.]MDP2177009.1 ABC transporter permease [Methylicorpusculum sp.]MDP3529466.1 ABC transporter permease [Methylicorpusculum sp.]MDZ4150320.1 ABC transporter permease [Methylicorpusculum sp.]